jgi:hypothetical protein
MQLFYVKPELDISLDFLWGSIGVDVFGWRLGVHRNHWANTYQFGPFYVLRDKR